MSPQKERLRRDILTRRDALTISQQKEKSHIIIRLLQGLTIYKGARHPMFYASFRSEVSTLETIKGRLEKGLPVILPKTIVSERRLIPYEIHSWDRDIKIGAYGIPEPDPSHARPISPKELDLVIVPGSVFDETCARHGYGGGFYDRFLESDAPQAYRIGLAFSCQVVKRASCEPHDQKMDLIITEERIIHCHRPN